MFSYLTFPFDLRPAPPPSFSSTSVTPPRKPELQSPASEHRTPAIQFVSKPTEAAGRHPAPFRRPASARGYHKSRRGRWGAGPTSLRGGGKRGSPESAGASNAPIMRFLQGAARRILKAEWLFQKANGRLRRRRTSDTMSEVVSTRISEHSGPGTVDPIKVHHWYTLPWRGREGGFESAPISRKCTSDFPGRTRRGVFVARATVQTVGGRAPCAPLTAHVICHKLVA